MLDTQMLIGSKFVDGHRERRKPSSTRRPGRRSSSSPSLAGAGRRGGRRRRRRRSQTWSRTTPAERSALLLKLADAHRGATPKPSPRSRR